MYTYFITADETVALRRSKANQMQFEISSTSTPLKPNQPVGNCSDRMDN